MERNFMLEQVQSLPALLAQTFDPLARGAERTLSDETLRGVESIYLYGSGDSYNAAVCAAQAFAQHAGIPATPVTALQASRYLAPTLSPARAARTLTVCISSSGEAARSAEAAMALRRAGCRTLAVTARPDSRVGRAVEHLLLAELPPAPPAPMPLPGVRSFAAPLLGLYLLAVSFGRRRGFLTSEAARTLSDELSRLGGLLANALDDGLDVLRCFAALCGRCRRLEFLGAGPCCGAGDFGFSKVLEALGDGAISQDLEEYAHQTFFSVDPEALPTVLLLPSLGGSVARAMEILRVLRSQGRPVLTLTDDRSLTPPDCGVSSVCLRQPVRETWIPLLFASLCAALTALIAHRPGDTYMHGHRGPYDETGLPTVRESRIIVDEERSTHEQL